MLESCLVVVCILAVAYTSVGFQKRNLAMLYTCLGYVIYAGWFTEIFQFFFWSHVSFFTLLLHFILTRAITADSIWIFEIRRIKNHGYY